MKESNTMLRVLCAMAFVLSYIWHLYCIRGPNMYVCMYVCVYVYCMYVCMFIYVRLCHQMGDTFFVDTYIHIYIYIYIY